MIDLISLCQELRVQFAESGHHHCHEGWVQVHCPFCGDGLNGWHLGFSLEYGNMNCWRCGKHSVREWLECVLPAGARSQAGALLHKYGNKKISLPLNAKPNIRNIRTRAIKPPKGSGPLTPRHARFLESRGFNPTQLQTTWNLIGTKNFSRDWNWRVLAPICNIAGLPVAYAGRALESNVRPKWRMTPKEEMGDNPKKLIYGIEKADPKQGILIVEGPSDVWRMGPGSVGLLGIDWKTEQAGILRHFKRRFILFDPEPIAQKRAEQLAHWLAPLPGETEILSGFKCDPGDLSQEKANSIMHELGLGGYNE